MHEVEGVAEIVVWLHVERLQLNRPINDEVVFPHLLADRFFCSGVKIISPWYIRGFNRFRVSDSFEGYIRNQ